MSQLLPRSQPKPQFYSLHSGEAERWQRCSPPSNRGPASGSGRSSGRDCSGEKREKGEDEVMRIEKKVGMVYITKQEKSSMSLRNEIGHVSLLIPNPCRNSNQSRPYKFKFYDHFPTLKQPLYPTRQGKGRRILPSPEPHTCRTLGLHWVVVVFVEHNSDKNCSTIFITEVQL